MFRCLSLVSLFVAEYFCNVLLFLSCSLFSLQSISVMFSRLWRWTRVSSWSTSRRSWELPTKSKLSQSAPTQGYHEPINAEFRVYISQSAPVPGLRDWLPQIYNQSIDRRFSQAINLLLFQHKHCDALPVINYGILFCRFHEVATELNVEDRIRIVLAGIRSIHWCPRKWKIQEKINKKILDLSRILGMSTTPPYP